MLRRPALSWTLVSLSPYFPDPVLPGTDCSQGFLVPLPPTAVGAIRGCRGPPGPETLLHWVPGMGGGMETRAAAEGAEPGRTASQRAAFRKLAGKSPKAGAADLERTTGGACSGRT